MRREVTSIDDLREIVGHPNGYVANKVGNRLSAAQQFQIAVSRNPTADEFGALDVHRHPTLGDVGHCRSLALNGVAQMNFRRA